MLKMITNMKSCALASGLWYGHGKKFHGLRGGEVTTLEASRVLSAYLFVSHLPRLT
jgi:hypothetical protein